MIRHVIDCYQLLAVSGDNASHVSLKLIVMLCPDQVLPSLHSENDLDIDLRVRIRHSMSRLPELPWCLDAYGYKDVAPTELLRCLDAYGYKDVAPNGAAQVFGRVWLQRCRSYGATLMFGRV